MNTFVTMEGFDLKDYCDVEMTVDEQREDTEFLLDAYMRFSGIRNFIMQHISQQNRQESEQWSEEDWDEFNEEEYGDNEVYYGGTLFHIPVGPEKWTMYPRVDINKYELEIWERGFSNKEVHPHYEGEEFYIGKFYSNGEKIIYEGDSIGEHQESIELALTDIFKDYLGVMAGKEN